MRSVCNPLGVVTAGVGDYPLSPFLFVQRSDLVVSAAHLEGPYRLKTFGLEVEKPLGHRAWIEHQWCVYCYSLQTSSSQSYVFQFHHCHLLYRRDVVSKIQNALNWVFALLTGGVREVRFEQVMDG